MMAQVGYVSKVGGSGGDGETEKVNETIVF
jgi:hypothetical protein